MEKADKIHSFTDLIAWKAGHQLVLKIYVLTENFAKKEQYSLTDQMRRAAVSITSNLAEGFSRRSQKDKTQFYFIALGSTTELQNQLLISRDLHYIDNNTFQEVANQSIEVHKLINGLIKAIRNSPSYT